MKQKMMEKKISKTKKIIVAEAIFVFGVLIYLFFSIAPTPIYPLQGLVIMEPDFTFEIENGEEIIISTDKNFTIPIVLKEGSDVTLPPGIYYWKVKSRFRESEIRNFTIRTNVGLNLKEKNESYELQNSGTVDLNVTKKKNGLTEIEIILDVGQSKEFEKDNSTYEGKQI